MHISAWVVMGLVGTLPFHMLMTKTALAKNLADLEGSSHPSILAVS